MAAMPPGAAAGGGSGSGLGVGTAAYIMGSAAGGHQCTGGSDIRLCIHARGDQTFRLNVISSVDDWATFEVIKSVASGVVNVDGGTAGYVNTAELTDWPCPSVWAVQIWAVGGTLGWKADYREFAASKS